MASEDAFSRSIAATAAALHTRLLFAGRFALHAVLLSCQLPDQYGCRRCLTRDAILTLHELMVQEVGGGVGGGIAPAAASAVQLYVLYNSWHF